LKILVPGKYFWKKSSEFAYLFEQDDLRFKLEYVHPLVQGLQALHPRLEGLRKLHNHTLRLLAFNKRKLSATYYDADFHKEAPAIWIDRAGIKASIVEVIKFVLGTGVRESFLGYPFQRLLPYS
jgi:hypothetical protein